MSNAAWGKANEVLNSVIPYKKNIFFTALGEILGGENRILNAVFIGDSITQGAGSSATVSQWQETGFFGQFRDYLALKYGDVGKGFRPLYAYNNAGDYNPWVFVGSWSEQNGWGPMGSSKKSAANGDTATLDFNGDGVAVVIATGSSSTTTFELIVDGGTPVVYSAYATSAGNYAKTVTVTGLVDGNHTLVVKNTTATTGILLLQGAYSLKGTKGIRCHMMGRSGKTINDAMQYDPTLQMVFDKFSPELTVISMLANDQSGGTAIKTYFDRMETIIQRARLHGEVVLITTGIRSDGGDLDLAGYVKVNYTLANKHGCKVVDIYEAWGRTYANADALGYMYDTVHPSVEGHTDIKNRLASTLGI